MPCRSKRDARIALCRLPAPESHKLQHVGKAVHGLDAGRERPLVDCLPSRFDRPPHGIGDIRIADARKPMLLGPPEERDALVREECAYVAGKTGHDEGDLAALSHEMLVDGGERNHLV